MENIQEYVINISFDNSVFKKITEFERRVDEMKRKLEKGFDIPAPTFLPPTSPARSPRGQRPDLMGPSPAVGFRKGRQVDTLRMKQQEKEEERLHKKTLSFLSQQRFNTEAITDEQRKTWKMALKASKTEEQMLKTKQMMVKQAVKLNQEHREAVKRLKKQHFLMQRMESSSKQMAGNMVSAFALGAVGTGIVTTGQNFEAINNTMLAVSADSKEAAENLKFVRDEAFRLGSDFTESGRAFSKMLSNRGEMSIQQTKEAFLGVAEQAAVLGLNADQTNRAMLALQQMMSKGTVAAEELKNQMAESGLAGAIKMMAAAAKDAGISTTGTTKELFKLQEQGLVVADKVLPHFAKRMRDAARENGALSKALDSNRVAMGRLVFSTQEAADTIFKTGFGEGLTDLFNTSAQAMRDLESLFKAFGRIMGSVFKIIARGVDLITPPLRLLGIVMDKITEQFGDLSAIVTGSLAAGLVLTAGRMGVMVGMANKLKWVFAAMLAPIMKVAGALMLVEELLNALIFKDKEGLLFSPAKQTETNRAVAKASAIGIQTKGGPLTTSGSFWTDPIGSLSALGDRFSEIVSGKPGDGKPTTVVGNVYFDTQVVGEILSETDGIQEGTRAIISPLLIQ